MPLVQIKGVAGYLTLEQKWEMIRRVTDAVLAVEGEGLRPVTWVTIEDVPPGAWGVGGKPVTADDLRAMAGKNDGS
jgi:4-oxalocrotonate tautomerase